MSVSLFTASLFVVHFHRRPMWRTSVSDWELWLDRDPSHIDGTEWD